MLFLHTILVTYSFNIYYGIFTIEYTYTWCIVGGGPIAMSQTQ